MGLGLGLAHGNRTYGASLRTGRPAQERHPALLPQIGQRTDYSGKYQRALRRISRLSGNKKAYTDPALRKEYTNKGYWVNIRLIRYADVLLMGAESANEKGISGEAIDYLEQVRARARGTNTNILPKVTTTDQGELREAIRHERRVELGLEFDRFYDLVRWGIAKEVLQAAGKNYQDKNALLPLPQTEIDKSKGVLVQNPDYQ